MNRLVDGERQKQYGDPVSFFTILAKVWSAVTGYEITPRMANVMMILFKVIRFAHKFKADTADDIDGYVEIGRRLG